MRQRKDNIKRGERTQKMMTFRADLDVADLLQRVTNKGRLINNLLREYLTKERLDDPDAPPSENDIEDTMP